MGAVGYGTLEVGFCGLSNRRKMGPTRMMASADDTVYASWGARSRQSDQMRKTPPQAPDSAMRRWRDFPFQHAFSLLARRDGLFEPLSVVRGEAEQKKPQWPKRRTPTMQDPRPNTQKQMFGNVLAVLVRSPIPVTAHERKEGRKECPWIRRRRRGRRRHALYPRSVAGATAATTVLLPLRYCQQR